MLLTNRWEGGELQEGFYHELHPNGFRRGKHVPFAEESRDVAKLCDLAQRQKAATIRHDPSTEQAISCAPLQVG